jgi:hypothetical protein
MIGCSVLRSAHGDGAVATPNLDHLSSGRAVERAGSASLGRDAQTAPSGLQAAAPGSNCLFRGVSGAFGQTGIGCLGIGGCEWIPGRTPRASRRSAPHPRRAFRGATAADPAADADSGFANLEKRIPIIVSGLGPRSQALAGELGDGLFVSMPNEERSIARSKETVRRDSVHQYKRANSCKKCTPQASTSIMVLPRWSTMMRTPSVWPAR